MSATTQVDPARKAPLSRALSRALRADPRWAVWRSPGDQPGWARPALLAIAALAAVLYARNLAHAGYAPYYSVATKSMSVSWRALLFGAVDPGASITIDKLAGSFVPQALSARLFGFHQWSLALPQVIMGVVSVLVLYRVVRRWAGPAAGLLAAGIFAGTPILSSMFGLSMEDGALIFCLVLAADRYQYAVMHGRLRSLVLAGVWVGIAFQAKMLEAWIIVPALAVGYLVAAPGPVRRRMAHVPVAGAAMLAVSASWMLLMMAVPAADRPYIDGSSNNSAFAMVVGYNGLERFGVHVPGALPFASGGSTVRAVTSGSGGASYKSIAGTDWAKLLKDEYATQIGWLYPLALAALVLGLWWSRGRPRTDLLRGGLVMWGTWLVTAALVLSKIVIAHNAYLAVLGPPLAALAAVGIVLGWRACRDGGARGWALPVVLVAEVAWVTYLSRDHLDFLPGLVPVVVAAAIFALAVVVPARSRRAMPSRLLTGGLATGVAAMLVVPTAWAASVLDPSYAGRSYEAGAGPGQAQPATPAHPGASGQPGAAGGGFLQGAGSGGLTNAQRRLYAYAQAHRDGAAYVFATDSWYRAGPYIMETGGEILPMGGFSGSVPYPTYQQAMRWVRAGTLRYFVLSASGARSVVKPSGRSGSGVGQIGSWVRSACYQIPPHVYGGTAAEALYRCDTTAVRTG